MNSTDPQWSESRIKWIMFSLLLLYPLVGMGIDLITPSLPAISKDLHVSHHYAKNLITIYLFGYLLGNFIIGFLSDALGRKKLLLLSFTIFTFISLLPALIPNIHLLLISRFVQGCTLAAFGVISRAIFADILSETKLIRSATLISTAWGIGPIIGPVIGGYLQYYFNWQMCFYFYALNGFIAIIFFSFILPETHFHRQPLHFAQLKNNFITIITHKIFLGFSLLMGLTYSLLIVFSTLGPFFIQNTLHYSSIYFGKLALGMGLLFLAGTLSCRYLLQKITAETLTLYVIIICSLLIFLTLILALNDGTNLWIMLTATAFIFLASSIIYPSTMGKGLAIFRHLAGSGAAVMNLINLGIVSLVSFMMSFIYVGSSVIIILVYFIILLLAALVYYFFLRKSL